MLHMRRAPRQDYKLQAKPENEKDIKMLLQLTWIMYWVVLHQVLLLWVFVGQIASHGPKWDDGYLGGGGLLRISFDRVDLSLKFKFRLKDQYSDGMMNNKQEHSISNVFLCVIV